MKVYSHGVAVSTVKTGRPGFDSRQGQGEYVLPLCPRVQSGCRAHPSSYSMGIGESFLRSKATGAWS